jgi:cell pole-organizing protein PopZ
MEEILASIRKIISEDQPSGAASAQPAPEPKTAAPPPPEPEAEADVLDLTDEMLEEVEEEAPPPPPEPARRPQPTMENDVIFASVEHKHEVEEPAMDESDFISDSTRQAVGQAFAHLDRGGQQEFASPGGSTLEALFLRAVQDAFTPTLQEWVDGHSSQIMDQLKPLIRAWMDTHLPQLIESAVQKEIARAAGTRKR